MKRWGLAKWWCGLLLATLAGCRPAEMPPRVTNPQAAAVRGHKLFIQICAQCHGMGGEGVPNMGATLIASPFVAERSDEELLAFLLEGRPAQIDRPAMPPKGGRLDLRTSDLFDIIIHLRVLAAEPLPSEVVNPSQTDRLPSQP
jgi:cytochrome c5